MATRFITTAVARRDLTVHARATPDTILGATADAGGKPRRHPAISVRQDSGAPHSQRPPLSLAATLAEVGLSHPEIK